MTFSTTVTQKGQITIPKALRDALGIEYYDQVELTLAKDGIRVQPTKDILDLAGTIRPLKNQGKDPVSARKAMEKSYKRF